MDERHLWRLYTNDTLVCKTAKAVGIAFSIDHWKPINTATTAYIENLGDRITLAITDSSEGIEAAKKLANQGISDASTAYNKAVAAASAAAGAQGGVNDLNTVVTEHTTVIQQTKDSITTLAGKISFDASGKVTNINTSGLVTTADFNSLLTKKVSFDANGKVMNISTSGLVTEAAFAGLFSSRINAEGLVKETQISAFITEDEAGNLISNATIQADKINFLGKTTINGNFVVDTAGNLTMNNLTANNGTFNGKIMVTSQYFKISDGASIDDGSLITGAANLVLPEIEGNYSRSIRWMVPLFTRAQQIIHLTTENLNVRIAPDGDALSSVSSFSFDALGSSGEIFGFKIGELTIWSVLKHQLNLIK